MVNMDSRYNVKWNNFHSALEMGFYELLEKEMMVDVTLIAEGKSLKAHKIILSISSLYFQEIFEAHPCPHPFIILKDVRYQELTNMVDFMYKGEVDVQQEDLASFLKLAETFKVKNFFIGDKQESYSEIQSSSSHVHQSLSAQICVKKEAPEIQLDDSETEELNNSFKEEQHVMKREKSTNVKKTKKMPDRIFKNPRVHLVRLPDLGIENYLKDDNKFLKVSTHRRTGKKNYHNDGLSTQGITTHQRKIPSLPPKCTSVVWEYFHRFSTHSVCRECGYKYRSNNSSSCKKHLESKHPHLYKKFLETRMKSCTSKPYQKSY